MKVLTTTLISLSLLGSAVSQMGAAQADASKTASAQDSHSIEIARSGSQQPSKAPAEHFTGAVQIEPLFPARDSSRASAGKVTFEPGARSAWHTHPLGQTFDHHGRHGLDSTVGRPDPRDSKGRCRLDSGGSETLARRYTKFGDDPHRNTGTAQRQSRRVVGKGHRRPIPQMIVARTLNSRRSE